MKIKDAIADRFMATLQKRPDSGSSKDKAVIFLHWKDAEASLYLDTSGESLTKHGYRKISGKAPLQEALAAAIITATGWNRQESFINPMCGGGTLAIEAALMALSKPPGLIRENYGFMHLKGFIYGSFESIREKLRRELKTLKRNEVAIIASDMDQSAIRAARENAKNAGVEHLIQFIKCSFAETPVPSAPGIAVFNPPYGERLGESGDLKSTYTEIGNFLKQRCPGYRGYIFTGSPDLAKAIGLKPKSRKTFFNGSLECRLLEFELYAGSRKSGEDQKLHPDPD